MACSVGFYGDGMSFQVVFNQSFWLRVLPGGTHLVQPEWRLERRILGGGRAYGVSFWPFPNSSGWWWLISSVFLSRTSCRKTTHANGYYGAWPGWVVPISVLPLTGWCRFQNPFSSRKDSAAMWVILWAPCASGPSLTASVNLVLSDPSQALFLGDPRHIYLPVYVLKDREDINIYYMGY